MKSNNKTQDLLRLTLTAFFSLSLGAAIQAQDDIIDWNVQSGDYNDFNNWDDGVVPQAELFLERASINNDGLAFVTNVPSPSPFGLLIGPSNSGTVEVRSGGNLSVVAVDGSGGATIVGNNNGEGILNVESGGTLQTVSLTSGGSDGSTVRVFSGGNLTVSGMSNLQRNTALFGPSPNFTTDSLRLGSDHRLHLEILNGNIQPIDVTTAATLGGALVVDFVGGNPTPGQTWDIIDAAEFRGEFSSFETTANVGDGLGLVVSTRPGGDNGIVAQLGIEAKLTLSVDRGTGEATLRNGATGTDLAIDGYGVLSPENAIDPAGWATLESQNGDWRATNATSTHVAETNLSSSQVIAGGSEISLGEIYSFTPSELGAPYPSVQFEYRLSESGDIRTGIVEMTGPENDLVLVVDPNTGATAIQNQSPFNLTIDAYGVLSESGSLSTSGWTSLQAGGNTDWREGNPQANHVAETNLTSTLPLPAQGEPISLGNLFDVLNSNQDLVFEYRMADGEIRQGTVVYGDTVTFDNAVCGDFDRDGDVDAADRTRLTTGWTGALPAGQGSASFENGDCDGDGDVDSADLNGVITNWTGAMAGNLVDGDDANLVYDPATGNVTIDATDTATEAIISFVLATESNDLRTDNSLFPFIDAGTNTDNTTFQIGQTDPLNQGAGPLVNLGNIFPTDLSLSDLSEYLSLADYASALGSGGTFDLILVPEPSALTLAFLAVFPLHHRRNRQSTT